MAAGKWLRSVILGLALVFLSQPAQAQTTGEKKLATLLEDVFETSVFGLLNSTGAPDIGVEDPTGFKAAGTIASALLVELGSFPIGSSSGGFAYFFDPTTRLDVLDEHRTYTRRSCES